MTDPDTIRCHCGQPAQWHALATVSGLCHAHWEDEIRATATAYATLEGTPPNEHLNFHDLTPPTTARPASRVVVCLLCSDGCRVALLRREGT